MTEEVKLRIPPNSKESEMMVLGCMLSTQDHLKFVVDNLTEADFYYNEHKTLFDVMKKSYNKDLPVDIHLICEELQRQDKLKSVGGAGYIASLVQYAGTSAYIEAYVEELKTIRIRRDIIHVSQESLNDSFGLLDPFEILDKLKNKIGKIEKNKEDSKSEISQIGEILNGEKSQIDNRSFLEKIIERKSFYEAHGKPYLTGIPTGFIDLDNKATPLEDTNLIIVAARPAMGKTALGMNIASYTCFEKNMPVGVISLEMGRDQLIERLISSRTRIPGENIKSILPP